MKPRLASVLLAAVLAVSATAGQATNVTLDILAVQATASAGDDSVGSLNRPIVSVLARDQGGDPVGTLGAVGRIGNDSAQIGIPGWTTTTLVVGAGGCVLQPIGFHNRGNGLYSIHYTSASTSGPCDWRPGDYVFALEVDINGYQGIGLGSFPID